MADQFANVENRTNPGDRHFQITPSDTVDIVRIGATGTTGTYYGWY